MSQAAPKVGIAGLDTSHSTAWVDLLQSLRLPVTVYDEGVIWSDAEVDAYCRERNLVRASTLDELAAGSDIIAILTCNWDRHVALAAPLLESGKTVYIDKPIACAEADLQRLLHWSGRRLVLGSANRYQPELLAWRRQPLERLHSFTAQIGPFYRAIHAVETGQTVTGPGARRVRWLADARGPAIEIEHEKLFSWMAGWERAERGFAIIRKREGKTETLRFRPDHALHQRLLDEVLRVHHGAAPLVSPAEAVEAIRILRAAWTSRQRGDAWVELVDPDLAVFSGADFARTYRGSSTIRLG